MFYYFVWVRSNRYHGKEPLTYSSDKRLVVGSIVSIQLQKDVVLGFVSGTSTLPKFKTKPIIDSLDLPPLPKHLMKTARWLIGYYPAPLGLITQQILPASFSPKQLALAPRSSFSKPAISNLFELTDEQSQALGLIKRGGTYLLHGRTGSGKTRLYIELANNIIREGQSVVILTPEISLTTQLANSFREVFSDRVIVLHSRQTPAERQRAWLDCLRSEEPLVVIGPRSALFAPLKDIGLIVMDEAHEGAYKQSQAPQYQTNRVASFIASQAKATLLLGSATPLVTDYYLAEQKNRPILKLTKLARKADQSKPNITIVDRKDSSLFSRSSYLSQPLIKAVEKSLMNHEQSLLYLNRRGTARLVLCEKCGWQAICPNCDLPLTYHGDNHQLRCHSCNYHSTPPGACPSCHNPSVVFKTAGTKAIVDDVKKIFPSAKVARFDTDNTKSERFEENYEAALNGEIDILVGTQLIAKGLDLPNLSTVGILLADTSLYLPDFTAQERTFQLINQVLGRVARGHRDGQAIIQTYHPDHPIIAYAVKNDYRSFYESELASRQQFLFPPFCHLLKLAVKRSTIQKSELAAENLKEQIISKRYRVRVEGPAPSFYEHINGKYQWQLIVKSPLRKELLDIMANLPANWSADIDPIDLL